jgi:phage regulator Rha-like protein
LQPAYYDVALTRKFARDEESEAMLDIIFGNRVYDIGAVYAFGNVFIDLITLADTNNRNVASYYERRQGAMERDIERLIMRFEEMD